MVAKQGDYSTLTLKYWLSRTEISGYAVAVGNGILFNRNILNALWGSIKLSLIVSVIVGSCGVLIGYAVARKRGTKLAGLVSGLAFFPYLVPSMAFGAIFLAVASKLTFLRGTLSRPDRRRVLAQAHAQDPVPDPEIRFHQRLSAAVRILYA